MWAPVITNLADEAHPVSRMSDALAGEMNRRALRRRMSHPQTRSPALLDADGLDDVEPRRASCGW